MTDERCTTGADGEELPWYRGGLPVGARLAAIGLAVAAALSLHVRRGSFGWRHWDWHRVAVELGPIPCVDPIDVIVAPTPLGLFFYWAIALWVAVVAFVFTPRRRGEWGRFAALLGIAWAAGGGVGLALSWLYEPEPIIVVW